MEYFVAIVLILLAAGLVLLARERRHRRRIRGLMASLEELEAESFAVEVVDPGRDASDSAASGDDAVGDRPPTADVLSGRTTHIQRLVCNPGDRPNDLADRVILRVHETLGEPVTPGGIAQDLCVSLRTLERGLASKLGCTPRQLILAMKMREAKRLLAEGKLSVSQTASRLGFSSAAHFSRRFTAFFSRPEPWPWTMRTADSEASNAWSRKRSRAWKPTRLRSFAAKRHQANQAIPASTIVASTTRPT